MALVIMRGLNREKVVYRGSRPAVRIQWKGREWNFHRDKPVSVPDDFAAVLLRKPGFIRHDDVELTLEQRLEGATTVAVRRWGAAGDLVMFRAACRAFLRTRPGLKLLLRCEDRFCHLFAADPTWAGVYGLSDVAPSRAQLAYSFDQVAEADHRGDQRHRVELFLAAMTDQRIELTAADWTLPVPEPATKWVDEHLRRRRLLPDQRQRPLVCAQLRGSTDAKRLPEEIMRRLIGRLSARFEVMLLEHDERYAARFMGDDGVHSMAGRDVCHGIHLLRRADLAVTFDSGALWMAHAAPVKTLAILGPTRPEQRITFHPLYPAGARAVALNELIDCPACFEAAKACAGAITCMRGQPDWDRVIELIGSEAEALAAGDVRLATL